jgi:DNA-binding NarL/FixJ family response regulator
VSIRVLVVDDRDDVLEMLVDMISSSEDLEVVGTAGDGVAALVVAQEVRPDVVLLDHAMPRRDGVSTLPMLRELVPEAALLLHTGYATPELDARARRLGADFVLAKGVTRAELVGAIRAAAVLRRSERPRTQSG